MESDTATAIIVLAYLRTYRLERHYTFPSQLERYRDKGVQYSLRNEDVELMPLSVCEGEEHKSRRGEERRGEGFSKLILGFCWEEGRGRHKYNNAVQCSKACLGFWRVVGVGRVWCYRR
jgi:hypothetical protein